MPPAAATPRSFRNSGRVSISTINLKEFKPLNVWADKKPCAVCGRKPTHYQERPNGKEGLRKICMACFAKAVLT